MRFRILAVAAAVPLILVPFPAQATMRTVPATVPADCSVDVTAGLQKYLDATVVNGDTVQLPSGACYRVDGTITLTDRHDLTFVGLGAGATLRMVSTPPATPKIEHHMITILGGSGHTFRNLAIDSTNTTTTFNVNREWYSGFEILGTSGVLIDNVHATDIWGDFVTIGPDGRPAVDVMADGITVRNSSADRVGRHVVSCVGCDNVTITGNTFSDVGYHVFDIEVGASWWHADNIRFTDNTITGYLHRSIVANAGIGEYITDVTITGNTDTATHRTCAAPVWVLDTEPTKDRWTISGNSLRALGPAFSLAGMSHVTVESNTVDNLYGGCSNQEAGMEVTNDSGLVRFNTFIDATRIFQRGASTLRILACGNMANGTPNRPLPC